MSGYLPPGAQLPSVRQLARDLQVAPNTVVRAYEELERGGWIFAAARRGFVVAAIPADVAEPERRERLRAAVSALLQVAHQFGWIPPPCRPKSSGKCSLPCVTMLGLTRRTAEHSPQLSGSSAFWDMIHVNMSAVRIGTDREHQASPRGETDMSMTSSDVAGKQHKTSVLIVDDEPNIVEFLKMGFGYQGFEVTAAQDGLEALRLAGENKPDLVVLDLMLPGMDGIEVARQLRKGSDVAIIMLTARDAVDDRVQGLDTGADDYLVKPFAFKELMARVRAVLRRHGRNLDRMLTFQDVTLDRDSHIVTRDGREIELTPREFELLELFMMHPRQVLTRDAILARIWGYDYYGDDNVIEVFVRHLREKLGDTPPEAHPNCA